MSPDLDEEPTKRALRDPATIVRRLGELKARAVAAKHPDALVIGSDQCVALDDEIFGKPGTEEAAVTQLLRLADREHTLVTSVSLLDAATDECRTEVETHRLRMRPLTEAQCRAYVQRDRPLDCAGAYKLESLGVALFEWIRGDDASAIVGLPLSKLSRLLFERGIDVLMSDRTSS